MGARWFKFRAHKVGTIADKAAREYMTEPRKTPKQIFISGSRRKKAAVTTIWLCFATGKTCVAYSYIILYGQQRRLPFCVHSTSTTSFAQYLEGLDLHRHKNVSTSRGCWYHLLRDINLAVRNRVSFDRIEIVAIKCLFASSRNFTPQIFFFFFSTWKKYNIVKNLQTIIWKYRIHVLKQNSYDAEK